MESLEDGMFAPNKTSAGPSPRYLATLKISARKSGQIPTSTLRPDPALGYGSMGRMGILMMPWLNGKSGRMRLTM